MALAAEAPIAETTQVEVLVRVAGPLWEVRRGQVEALFLAIGALIICLLRGGKSLALVPVATPLCMCFSAVVMIILGARSDIRRQLAEQQRGRRVLALLWIA